MTSSSVSFSLTYDEPRVNTSCKNRSEGFKVKHRIRLCTSSVVICLNGPVNYCGTSGPLLRSLVSSDMVSQGCNPHYWSLFKVLVPRRLGGHGRVPNTYLCVDLYRPRMLYLSVFLVLRSSLTMLKEIRNFFRVIDIVTSRPIVKSITSVY